jgi:hypothetical protein
LQAGALPAQPMRIHRSGVERHQVGRRSDRAASSAAHASAARSPNASNTASAKARSARLDKRQRKLSNPPPGPLRLAFTKAGVGFHPAHGVGALGWRARFSVRLDQSAAGKAAQSSPSGKAGRHGVAGEVGVRIAQQPGHAHRDHRIEKGLVRFKRQDLGGFTVRTAVAARARPSAPSRATTAPLAAASAARASPASPSGTVTRMTPAPGSRAARWMQRAKPLRPPRL